MCIMINSKEYFPSVFEHAGDRHVTGVKRIKHLIDDSGILGAVDFSLTVEFAEVIFFPDGP